MIRGLAAIAIAGCAAPTGAAQTWPPPLGLAVSSAVVADLDRDGALDLLVAATGAPAGEGLYLVRGGVDWDGATIASFTRFVPHTVAAISALAVVDRDLVLAYTVKGKATLERLDPETLTTLATLPLGIASATRLVVSDVDAHALVLGDDAVIDGAATGGPRPLPPPTGATWLAPQAAVGFAMGSVAVATPTQVFTAALAAGPQYATVRPARDAVALTTQIAATLADPAGAPVTAIVGVDVAGSRLCAIDVAGTVGAACFAIDPVGADVRLTALPFAAGVAVASGGAVASYTALVLDGVDLAAAGPRAALSGPAPGIVLAVPDHLIALDGDGAIACLGPGC